MLWLPPPTLVPQILSVESTAALLLLPRVLPLGPQLTHPPQRSLLPLLAVPPVQKQQQWPPPQIRLSGYCWNN
jgi:hypothetical protein